MAAMTRRNRLLLIVALLSAGLFVTQQLTLHLFMHEQSPEQSELVRQLSNRKLQLTNGLPPINRVHKDHAEDNSPGKLGSKQEIISLLQRLAFLLKQENSRDLLQDIQDAVMKQDGVKSPKNESGPSQQAAKLAVSSKLSESPPKDKPQVTAPGKIPKILHQTFASVNVNTAYQALIENCLRLNPDWKYYLWTDEDADALMARHFPSLLKTVKLFKHELEKADALRYMVLYKFGGIYIDMDVECRKPFYPSLSERTAFLDQEHPVHSNLLYGKTYSAMNSAMGCLPGHPFFKRLIDRVAAEKNFGNPVSSTGPLMLASELEAYKMSETIKQHPVELLPYYIMSPAADTRQPWKAICHAYKHLQAAKEKLKQWRVRELTLKEEACLFLDSQEWKPPDDSRPETVAVHKFMHLGYPATVKRLGIKLSGFNVTIYFKDRIHFYAKENPLTPELRKLLK